jgi:hypothetical protein
MSITPEAKPIEKLTILFPILLERRTISPPTPVAKPAMRLKRNGSRSNITPLPFPTFGNSIIFF